MRDYHALGVQNLYIFNPITLEAWAWTPEATTTPPLACLEILSEGDTLSIPETRITVHLTTLFDNL